MNKFTLNLKNGEDNTLKSTFGISEERCEELAPVIGKALRENDALAPILKVVVESCQTFEEVVFFTHTLGAFLEKRNTPLAQLAALLS